jgi:hypothetical protein
MAGNSFGKNMTLHFVKLGVEIPNSVIRADHYSLLVQNVTRIQTWRNDVYRDRGLGFAVYNSPVNICAPPIFWEWGVMYVHESAAFQNPTRQDPVKGGDDGAIRSALDNRLFDTFEAKIRKYWHHEAAGALDDFIASFGRAGVSDETSDPEFCCQRFQGAEGGGTHSDKQNCIHKLSPDRYGQLPGSQAWMSQYLDEGKVLRGCSIEPPCQYLADLESSGLESDDRLRPYGRRKNTHVTSTGRFSWPYGYPGGSKRRTVHVPPELDQDRAWRFSTQESRVIDSKCRHFARLHRQDDSVTMRRYRICGQLARLFDFCSGLLETVHDEWCESIVTQQEYATAPHRDPCLMKLHHGHLA